MGPLLCVCVCKGYRRSPHVGAHNEGPCKKRLKTSRAHTKSLRNCPKSIGEARLLRVCGLWFSRVYGFRGFRGFRGLGFRV